MGAITTAIAAGTTIYGVNEQKKAAEKAADAQVAAADTGIQAQREATDTFLRVTEPFRGLGTNAIPALINQANRREQVLDAPTSIDTSSRFAGQDLAALNVPDVVAPTVASGFEAARPTFNQTLEQVNPQVAFLRDEGFRDIQESAAAKGKLSSGGTLRDLARFNTQLASTVAPQLQQQAFEQQLAARQQELAGRGEAFQQRLAGQQQQIAGQGQSFQQQLANRAQQAGIEQDVFNRDLAVTERNRDNFIKTQALNADLQQRRFGNLLDLVRLGANAATGQGQAGLSAAGNIGNLAQAAGQAQGNAAIGRSNAITGGIGQLAGLAGNLGLFG